MKTLTQTLFAAALTVVVLTSSAFSTFATQQPTTISSRIPSVINFNKIWVSGNVKIILTQGDKEIVQGTESFNPEKTSVLSKGQTLYINSMESSQVTINITVKDLQRIEAYGQSVVVTSNNFDVKYLQLFLSQSATARIKATVGSIYSVVNDSAVLKISGTADQSTIVASNMNNVKFNNFATLKSSQYASEEIMIADRSSMAIAK
ncbi:GIN domain-containing protein [Pedobacter sp. PWIIR3]